MLAEVAVTLERPLRRAFASTRATASSETSTASTSSAWLATWRPKPPL